MNQQSQNILANSHQKSHIEDPSASIYVLLNKNPYSSLERSLVPVFTCILVSILDYLTK